jgi:nucleoside-diphosphate-sugar epimerase
MVLIEVASNLNTKCRTVMVTGATGFIGSHLVKMLSKAGYKIRLYSRKPFEGAGAINVGECSWHHGTLDDFSTLAASCDGVDTVFHLAGLAHVDDNDSEGASEMNTRGCENVYSACVNAGVKRLIYFSSIHASTPEHSPYAASKTAAEECLKKSSSKHPEVHVTILRPSTVYGSGMKGNLATYFRYAAKGLMPSLPRLANTLRLVSVDDLCRVAMSVADAEITSESVLTYTVTDGLEYNANMIENILYQHLGRRKPRVTVPIWILRLAAVTAQFVNTTGIKKNQIGVRLFDNLVGHRQRRQPSHAPHFDFIPTDTLESQMPNIISSLVRN